MADVRGTPGFFCPVCFLPSYKCILNVPGKKKKEQHDANQAGMGLNPAYAGAYGATPAVSMFS